MPRPLLRFLGFTLDADNACLSSKGMRVSLSPKDCTLLYHLAANAGRVLSHEALLRLVWGETAVGPDVLKVRVARIRRLLADDASDPQFIANVHGEGYRFLPRRDFAAREAGTEIANALCPPVVGREPERRVLDAAFLDATARRRQMILVTGEAGIGKTTLIDTFVDRLRSAGAWIGRGQCIEHYGSGEPYLPVMEALSQLGRHDDRGRLKKVLQQYAPSWLLQLPALLDPDERQRLQRLAVEPNRDRMLRELAEALEALDEAAIDEEARPLLLVLEDLHWADVSTLDLLQMLARRREPARLLVLVSYRSIETTRTGHPLGSIVHDLRARRAITELALGRLNEDDVARYLDGQFPNHTFPAQLAALLHQRTEGHPLFLSDIIRDLQARDVVVRADAGWAFDGDAAAISAMMPSSIDEFFAKQRDGLTGEDQQLLEAASTAGVEFSAASIAAALGAEATDVEERCLGLVRHKKYLNLAGTEEWRDGTQSMRFAFPHALYQELWQKGVNKRSAKEWHLRIAEREEAAYAERAPEIAPALAAHFEHGGDYRRAILYCEHAGRLAVGRAANIEAMAHLRRGLDLLTKLPDTPDHVQLELRLHIGVGTVSALAEGFGSADAVAAFRRAHDICRQSREVPELLDALFGLSRFFWIRGEMARARELGDQMEAMVTRSADPVRTMAAHAAQGSVLAMQGEIGSATSVLKQGLDLARTHWCDALVGVYAGDLEVVCASTLANMLQVGGSPDQALACMEETLAVAQCRHPVSQVCALYGAAFFYQVRADPAQALRYANALQLAAADHQLTQYTLYAGVHRGWALVVNGQPDEGIALLRANIEVLRRAGAAGYLPQVLVFLADACKRRGDVAEARQALGEAFAVATRNEKGLFDAELHRLDAELRIEPPDVATGEAEAAFNRALAVARAQGAKLWELRAALSLARMWVRQGNEREARALVLDTYETFTEGFDTPDLSAARTFLEGLA